MNQKSGFYDLARQAILEPKEMQVAAPAKGSRPVIGVPKEISFQENRVGLTPQAVRLLVDNGHQVWIERGAGSAAKFSDSEYEAAGARICEAGAEVFAADIIIKVAFPTLEEINAMQEHRAIISALNLAMLSAEQIKLLQKKKATAIAYEYLEDETGILPVIQGMSEIAGTTSILIAAEYLSNINHGKGVMLGGISGIPPSNVIILGAGTVALFASRTALGLGAEVKVFDNNLYRLRRLQNMLQQRIFTSLLHPNILERELKLADVVVGALRPTSGRTPMVVSEAMVMDMKPGSIIIDVSIDQGGVFETSEVTNHTQPIYIRHGVIHYCVPNIASRVSRTASYALSNIFTPILVDIGASGGIKNYLWEKEGVRKGVYIYKGNLTSRHLSERFGIPYKDIDLLIAAYL